MLKIVLALTLAVLHSFHYEIPAYVEECFHENMKVNDTILLSYEVPGGAKTLEFTVFDIFFCVVIQSIKRKTSINSF